MDFVVGGCPHGGYSSYLQRQLSFSTQAQPEAASANAEAAGQPASEFGHTTRALEPVLGYRSTLAAGLQAPQAYPVPARALFDVSLSPQLEASTPRRAWHAPS